MIVAVFVLAYLAGVAANPAYTARFRKELAQPGLRIPITARPELFTQAVELGRRVIWLQTFGERFESILLRRGERIVRGCSHHTNNRFSHR